MNRHACSPILLVAAALGARAESTTSNPFDFGVHDKSFPVDLTMPLALTARPACLTVALASCQWVASAGFSVASGQVLDGCSILIPRQLMCWGCLLMASLVAWHRRVAKSPCSRPEIAEIAEIAKSPCSRPRRPREKQGVHGAPCKENEGTVLHCTEVCSSRCPATAVSCRPR